MSWTLDTARMHMTRIAPEHLDALVALDADPEVMRYISDGEPNPREVYVESLLARMMEYADQPYGYAAACVDEAFVGWFHLRPSVFEPSILELGYRLRRAAWGQGLASEGGRALVAYAFDTLGGDRVDACAHPDNAASIRVMAKCGMRFVGRHVHPRGGFEVVRHLVARQG